MKLPKGVRLGVGLGCIGWSFVCIPYAIIKYINEDIELEVYVSVEEEMVWLSREQIGILCDKSRSTISKHINFIFENKELEEKSNVHFFHIANSDKPVSFLSLEVVLLVGTRTKSKIVNSFYSWCKDVINELKAHSNNSNLVRFNDDNISLDIAVSPEEQTIWMNQNQIAILFDSTQPNISMHIKNIIEESELDFNSVHKDFLYTASDGKSYYVSFFNLDMVLAIGYRIKTKRAIEFRRWASSVLKEYLLKGYVINEDRTLVTNENYINLINRVDSIDNRLKIVEQNEKHLLIEDKIIYENKLFDALVLINEIINTAKESIVVIDPYIDISTLNAFKNKPNGVLLTFISSSKNIFVSNEDINRFIKEYGELIVKIDDSYHDRYLIIDNKLFYHLGSSINYLGKRFSQITLIKDADIIETLKGRLK